MHLCYRPYNCTNTHVQISGGYSYSVFVTFEVHVCVVSTVCCIILRCVSNIQSILTDINGVDKKHQYNKRGHFLYIYYIIKHSKILRKTHNHMYCISCPQF